jgi:hypothetical protein
MAITGALGFNPIWYVADTNGEPLAGGYLATFSSLDRTFKAVYKDPALAFPWPYVDILNSQGIPIGIKGILFDANGSQGPFYFKYDSATPSDLYYLEFYNSDGDLVSTVDDYSAPGTGGGGGGTITEGINLVNLVSNPSMWRNRGTATFTPTVFEVLAPGANTGLALTSSLAGPDICFIKNDASATDTISFPKFTVGDTFPDGTPTPVDYLRYNCSVASATETKKVIQFPITQGVQNIQDQITTVTFYAKTAGGAGITLTANWLQFFGDGPSAASPGAGPSYLVTAMQTISLTGSWQRFEISTPNANVPDISGGVIGECGNDGLFLQFAFPLNTTCDTYFTLPAVFLSQIVPDEYYITYDMIDGQVDTPRTGDILTSMKSTILGGWVQMNDGTIGSLTSNATNRAATDTFPLFNLLWSLNSTYVPMYTNAGALQARGATAAADFSANYQIALPKSLGQVLGGTAPSVAAQSTFTTAGGAGATLLTVTVGPVTAAYGVGTPVVLSNSGGSLPTGLTAGTVYYAVFQNATQMGLATTIANALAGTLVTFTGGSGSGTNYIQITSNTLGLFQGETSHIQLAAEVAQTNLFTNSQQVYSNDFGGPGALTYLAPTLVNQGTVSNPYTTGNASPSAMNVTQPTTWMNVFIKL